MKKFEPKILGFLCNWCAYAGADLAGVSRVQYPTNLRVIRVMCSGRVDPILIFRAFELDIDGVAVLGCHHGDCHYQTGNYYAEKKIQNAKNILQKVGINKDRLYLDWVSAAEGVRFGEVVTGFVNTIKEIGPITDEKNLKEKCALGKELVKTARIRWLVGKEYDLLEHENVYGDKVSEQEFKDLMEKNINSQYERNRIFSSIKTNPLTVREIAKEIDLCPTDVFKHLTYLENIGEISLVDFKENSPRYMVLK